MSEQPSIPVPMKPWERLEKESHQAYKAFVLYREWPYINPNEDRSVRVVGERLNKSSSAIKKWSTRFEWVMRAQAYDEEMLSQVDPSVRQEFVDRLQEQMRIILAMRGRGIQALQRIRPEDLTPIQALLYLEKSVKLEQSLIRLWHDTGLHSDEEFDQEEQAVIVLPAKQEI